jgi:hypothetical protein
MTRARVCADPTDEWPLCSIKRHIEGEEAGEKRARTEVLEDDDIIIL